MPSNSTEGRLQMPWSNPLRMGNSSPWSVTWSGTSGWPTAPNRIESYAAETEFGERLVDGTFVIALAVGMSVIDISQNATANLGYDDIRHHAPVLHGDTMFAESEVLDKRESDSRDHVGIVTTELRAYNQHDDLVLSLERTPMVLKREHAQPSAAKPPGWIQGVGTQPNDLD